MVSQATGLINMRDVRRTPLPDASLVTGGVTSVSLPLVGAILDIEGKLSINYDIAAATTQTEDSVARLIKEVRIRDGAGFSYYSTHTGKLLQWMSNFKAHRDDYFPSAALSQTQANGQVATVNFVIDFQDTPSPLGAPAPDAISAILTKSRDLTELVMQVRLGDHTDLEAGGTYTINSVTLTLTPRIVLYGSASWRRLLNVGVARPEYRSYETQISGAVSALGKADNLPTGFLLGKSLLIVEDPDSSNNRDNAQLSEFAYEDYLAGQRPFDTDFDNYERSLNNEYGFLPSGVVLLDWQSIVGGEGLNRVSRGETEDRLLYTTSGNVNVQELHKGWSHY